MHSDSESENKDRITRSSSLGSGIGRGPSFVAKTDLPLFIYENQMRSCERGRMEKEETQKSLRKLFYQKISIRFDQKISPKLIRQSSIFQFLLELVLSVMVVDAVVPSSGATGIGNVLYALRGCFEVVNKEESSNWNLGS
ncbi:hypothetical protein U1Q18_007193 [Sarracenia purpurea var. burkii]